MNGVVIKIKGTRHTVQDTRHTAQDTRHKAHGTRVRVYDSSLGRGDRWVKLRYNVEEEIYGVNTI